MQTESMGQRTCRAASLNVSDDPFVSLTVVVVCVRPSRVVLVSMIVVRVTAFGPRPIVSV